MASTTNTDRIPNDLIKFQEFVSKRNIPLNRTTEWRLRQDPDCPPRYRLTPKTIFYSERELEQFFLSRREA